MSTDKEIKSVGRDGKVKKTTLAGKVFGRNDVSYLTYVNLGFYLVAPLLAGVFFGTIIDNRFHTRPLFIILFLIIGTGICFYNLIKLTRDASH